MLLSFLGGYFQLVCSNDCICVSLLFRFCVWLISNSFLLRTTCSSSVISLDTLLLTLSINSLSFSIAVWNLAAASESFQESYVSISLSIATSSLANFVCRFNINLLIAHNLLLIVFPPLLLFGLPILSGLSIFCSSLIAL